MAQASGRAPSTRSPQVPEVPKITSKSLIQDALDRNPDEAEKLFQELGVPCWDCAAAEVETLEFGFCLMEKPKEELDQLIARINALEAKPPEVLPEPVGPLTWLWRKAFGGSTDGESDGPRQPS